MTIRLGLVHAPVTPFKAGSAVDHDTLGRLIEFQLGAGAEAIAAPLPHAEDMSLTDEEQRSLIEFVIRQVNGRVPVVAHVSDAGTDIAVERAQHAQRGGAAAIFSHPPYFWHPKGGMVVEHLVRIGTAVALPFFLVSPVVEYPGTHLTTDIVLQVAQRVPNLAGLVDTSMDWVFMAEVMSSLIDARPDFQLLPGTDYMVPPGVLGATGAVSVLSAVAPRLVRQVYELCAAGRFAEARRPQEQLAALYHLARRHGAAGLKEILRLMGRDCGQARAPVHALTSREREQLAAGLAGLTFLEGEPRGW